MTSHLLKLRDYQTECIRAIHTSWDGGLTRPAAVLPTGAGKTVVFSHLAEQYLQLNPTKRVLVLAHTDELVNQAASKMRAVAPHRTVGIVKAAQNEVAAQVVVASVQSLRAASRRAQLRQVGLIIVDECHHAVAKTYRTILEHFGAFDSPISRLERPLVVGFTATLARGDDAKLSDVWQDVAYRKDIAFMIRRGYLLDVKGRRVHVPDLDLRSVKKSGGDYQEGALGEALSDAMAPEIVAEAYAEHAADRQGIVFCPTVASAYEFADAFNAGGIKSEVVHGALARDERREILGRLNAGDTQVIINCMVLTEGFDAPCVSCIVVARPTRSAPLYQQMVGRGLRPDLTLPVEERGHALVLDVVGASTSHDLRSLIDLSSREERDIPEDQLEELSLLELEEYEEEQAPGTEPEVYWRGPVEVTDFDPLARDSDRAWGKTTGGTYYLSYGSGYVFLAPAEVTGGETGNWDLVWCGSTSGQQGLCNGHRNLSFEMALSWGEDEALERGGDGTKTLSARKSAWRRQPATDAQKWRASREGVDVTDEMTKGEVSEAIDNVMASRRIDALVALVTGR